MPSGLKRYQQTHQLHFITFTCFHRAPFLQTASARDLCVLTLERVRVWYGFYVVGYVVMPEHVRLLISEPERRRVPQVPRAAFASSPGQKRCSTVTATGL